MTILGVMKTLSESKMRKKLVNYEGASMNVTNYKLLHISGDFINLLPYSEKYIEKIVEMRNVQKVRYFLNQIEPSTFEKQLLWTKDYLERENDLYWVIQSKETGEIIGTTSLYDIDSIQAEKGRFIIDENVSIQKPYALEAELLIINFAFTTLKLEKLVTCTREDNLKMESINKRFGFEYSDDFLVRGIRYKLFNLNQENYSPMKFEKIINHWKNRK